MMNNVKVGDKVTCLTHGKGFIIAVRHYPFLLEVTFDNNRRTVYTQDGRLYDNDKLPSLHHGHGTFNIEFVEDKEPEYEYQVVYKRLSTGDHDMTSYFYTSKENFEAINKNVNTEFVELCLPSKRLVT